MYHERLSATADHFCLALLILDFYCFAVDLLDGCSIFVLESGQLLGLGEQVHLLVFPLLLETLGLVTDRLEVRCARIESLFG